MPPGKLPAFPALARVFFFFVFKRRTLRGVFRNTRFGDVGYTCSASVIKKKLCLFYVEGITRCNIVRYFNGAGGH